MKHERGLHMKVGSILIMGFVLFSFMASYVILTEPLASCDPSFPLLRGVTLEGAHIVSEGAYFRFWIFNNNSFSINVTVNGVNIASIPPESGIDYDVIAPQISAPYEQVTYKFLFFSLGAVQTVDFTVLVLNSSFVPIFSLTIPILIAMAAIILFAIAFVILKRRKSHISSLMFLGILLIISGIEIIFIFVNSAMNQLLHLDSAGIAHATILSIILIMVGILILMLWGISFYGKPTEPKK